MSENSRLEKLRNFRSQTWQKVLDGKLSLEDFVFGSFNFLKQYRFQPNPKAHEKEEILFNYMYWHIALERKVMIENELIKYNMGNDSLFLKVADLYIKRRDQMVRRYILDNHDKIKLGLIFDDSLVELHMESGAIFYCSKDTSDKLKISLISNKKSKNQYYLNLLRLKKPDPEQI